MTTDPRHRPVLVIPRALLPPRPYLPWAEAGSLLADAEASASWLPRARAEASDELVQPIPCAVLRRPDGRLLVLRRVRAARADLAARLSVVVGGHVDDIGTDAPVGLEARLRMALCRELEEELELDDHGPLTGLAVVVDQRDVASSRHVGFVYEVVSRGTPAVRATEEFVRANPSPQLFVPPARLAARRSQLDPWSSILVEHLAAG